MEAEYRARRMVARYGPLVALGAAVILAVVAFLVHRSAEDDQAKAAADLSALEVMESTADRNERIDETNATIEEQAAKLADATAAGPDLAALVGDYQDKVDLELDAVDQQIATAREMASIRSQQADAVARTDVAAYNELQSRYDLFAAAWNAVGLRYTQFLGSLPAIAYDDLAARLPDGAPTLPALTAPTNRVLAPPTGPAQIVGSFPDPVGCEAWQEGCRWEYTVTFTETNQLAATIQRIGVRYIDRGGRVWIIESGEWHDEIITIEAGGTADYDSWVRTTPTESPNLDGGTVVVSWTGVDVEGNAISGETRGHLQPRREAG